MDVNSFAHNLAAWAFCNPKFGPICLSGSLIQMAEMDKHGRLNRILVLVFNLLQYHK